MMKFLWVVLLVITTHAHAIPLDRIVAIVNDEVILESELIDMENKIRMQVRERGESMPPADVLNKQVLERLIMQRLQTQQARKVGIRVGDDALNAALQQIAAKNNLTLRQFRDVLEDDGYSYTDFRESIRDEMTITRLRKSQVEDKVIVSERELDNFLATQSIQSGGDEEYELQHILISMPEPASPDEVQQAQKKLEKIQSLIREGGNFSEIAVGYSDGQNALEGGSLGWRKQAELPSLFAKVVPNLTIGEVSEPLRSGSGFHLVRVKDKRSSEVHLVKQTLASHILIKTNELLTDQEAEQRLEKLRQRVINGEDFAEIARANSDDTGSAIDGGSLGWASPGVMVPEFEEKMNELAIGEVSEVFRSRFGWHIIKVYDRREENLADEYKRGVARQQLRQRKINENLETWLRTLRDEAYVEYRDS